MCGVKHIIHKQRLGAYPTLGEQRKCQLGSYDFHMNDNTTKTSGRIAVYTAIFGQKDTLHEPRVRPLNCDFICFTDQHFSSSVWDVRKVERPLPDATRSARMYKILAHQFLPEYELSIWVDGNITVRSDVNEPIERYLKKANMAVYDHGRSAHFPLKSLAEHLNALRKTALRGKPEDDMEKVEAQAKHYAKEGFPDKGGQIWSCVLLRRHNAEDVKGAMEAWWDELVRWSKRDQMSFNYVAWKKGLEFVYMEENPTDNKYFFRTNHRLPLHRIVYSYFLGGLRRLKGS